MDLNKAAPPLSHQPKPTLTLTHASTTKKQGDVASHSQPISPNRRHPTRLTHSLAHNLCKGDGMCMCVKRQDNGDDKIHVLRRLHALVQACRAGRDRVRSVLQNQRRRAVTTTREGMTAACPFVFVLVSLSRSPCHQPCQALSSASQGHHVEVDLWFSSLRRESQPERRQGIW